MADPWLTIIGLGEDGAAGLSPPARAALDAAEVVMGPRRHLGLLAAVLEESGVERKPWPVPFADGLPQLEALRGRRVVVLASGDPFWFGAGAAVSERFGDAEWQALPGPSVFSLAANVLGWRLEETICLGLHAAPLSRLRPHLGAARRLMVTLRDGPAVADLTAYLCDAGFAETQVHVMEALGGPRQRVRCLRADGPLPPDIAHPVAVALEPVGPAITLASGRPDALFETDGQITKRPVRALTLSALAPRPGERLWDIGGGSGSVAIEWLLSDPSLQAISLEPRSDRATRIRGNAARLGVDRLEVVEGAAPEALDGLAAPDTIFVGGGLSRALLDRLFSQCVGARLVANAVTLESEATLIEAQARVGGTLLRIDLADAAAIGTRRGWKASYPLVQWSVTL